MDITSDEKVSKSISRDLDVLLKCSFPSIVKCYGCLIANNQVWIFMELMSSCFDKILKKIKQPLPEEIIGKVALSVSLFSKQQTVTINLISSTHILIHFYLF